MKALSLPVEKKLPEEVFFLWRLLISLSQKVMLVPDLTETRFHHRLKNYDSEAGNCKFSSHRCPASIDRCGNSQSSAFLKVNPGW